MIVNVLFYHHLFTLTIGTVNGKQSNWDVQQCRNRSHSKNTRIQSNHWMFPSLRFLRTFCTLLPFGTSNASVNNIVRLQLHCGNWPRKPAEFLGEEYRWDFSESMEVDIHVNCNVVSPLCTVLDPQYEMHVWPCTVVLAQCVDTGRSGCTKQCER